MPGVCFIYSALPVKLFNNEITFGLLCCWRNWKLWWLYQLDCIEQQHPFFARTQYTLTWTCLNNWSKKQLVRTIYAPQLIYLDGHKSQFIFITPSNAIFFDGIFKLWKISWPTSTGNLLVCYRMFSLKWNTWKKFPHGINFEPLRIMWSALK